MALVRAHIHTQQSRALGLTAQQAAVIRLIAAGLTDSEIAKELFLSHNTVKTHLRRIYRALGVRSRAELVAVTVAHNVITIVPIAALVPAVA